MNRFPDKYIPPHNDERLGAYYVLRDAVIQAKKEESYLSLEQIAMAIVSGLEFWHAAKDGEKLAEEIKYLISE